MAYPVADPYRTAIRNGLAWYYTIDATLGGTTVATGLKPSGGSITDTTKPGVRRLLSLELPGGQAVYNLLKPTGMLLTATCHVKYTAQTWVDIPAGVFDIDSDTLSEGDGKVTLTAPDKWVRISRARFMGPATSTRGLSVVGQIQALIRGALGASEPVNVTATSTATVGVLTWDKDRAQAIIDLATSIGAWVFFDRTGTATIADIPSIGASADWLVDASPTGVMVSLDRSQSRVGTYNVVVASCSATSGTIPPTQFIWDNDPASPTYAGPGLGYGTTPPSASTAGPFGIVPYFYDTPILTSATALVRAGSTILARTTGLTSLASWDQVVNPAVDAFDRYDVLPPGVSHYQPGSGGGAAAYPSPSLYPSTSLYPGSGGTPVPPRWTTSGRVLERHVADTVSHPLVLGGSMPVSGRSTRTDAYTDGSGY